MENRTITADMLELYKRSLEEDEKSQNTIDKYMRDIRRFCRNCQDTVTKASVLDYKQSLIQDGYSIRSINSMLAAINSFFSYLGWHELHIKSLRLQPSVFCSEDEELTKEEYYRLCKTAEIHHKERLSLIIQTLCCTGIRVSELSSITVEAVRKGNTTVYLKGKSRTIFIVRSLQKKLIQYSKKRKIMTGSIFITRTGQSVSRSNIWKEMKMLCTAACVNPKKVFPHNLRHLFARTFYNSEKDIAKLADILGHSNINTTRIYIVSSGSQHRKTMERMDLIFHEKQQHKKRPPQRAAAT